MNQRRFGVEIECGGGGGCAGARTLLQAAGLTHWAEQAIHPDGSGVEIPSPILQGRKGFRELKQVMDLLRANGFSAGRADGLHVHHDAPDFDRNEPLIAHTIELWEANLDLVKRFVHPRRATSGWCVSYAKPDGAITENANWTVFKQTKDLSNLLRSRYYAMNVTGVRGSNNPPGTIEFRLHEGTLDYNKAAAWVRFGQAFLDFALATFSVGEIITCSSRTALLKHVKVSGATRSLLLAAQPQAPSRNERGVFVAA